MDGGKADGASFDETGCQQELPAFMYDPMETFAADGPETSAEAGKRVDGLAQELRSARAGEAAFKLAAVA